MGDSESLLLVVVVLYLCECLVWVPRGAVVLTSWWGRSFRLRHPGVLLGNTRGGLHLGAPLPPLGTVFLCQQVPFSVSPQALLAYSALCLDPADRLRHSGQWWPWEKVETITVKNRTIQINGTVFCQSISPGAARFLAHWLEKIRVRTAGDRPRIIREFIQAMLAQDQVESRWRRLGERSRVLRMLCNATFLYLFLAVPWLLWRHGWLHVGWWLLGGLLAQTIGIALLFRRCHRTLFPKAEEERFKQVLTMLLAPPAALRAADHLGRPLLEQFHTLAAARLLLPPARFRAVAREFLIDLHYPVLPTCPARAPEVVATEQWFRQTVLGLIDQYLRECDLRPETLLSPPQRTEPLSRAYCPRCGTQFTKEEGTCLDCGGRSLQRLTSGPDVRSLDLLHVFHQPGGLMRPELGQGIGSGCYGQNPGSHGTGTPDV